MRFPFPALGLFASLGLSAAMAAPELPGVTAAMQQAIAAHEIAGAVTFVATRDQVVHLAAAGEADVATHRPMTTDAMFWIASMTKPVTAVALLMLQDEGKLALTDPVAKYLPEFAQLRTPSGRPANLTILQLINHTSDLAEPKPAATQAARTLPELVQIYLSEPMQFEPGSSWRYTSSAFNAAGLVVQVVSGQPFEDFLQERLFNPLGMEHTTFYPNAAQQEQLAHAYRANPAKGTFARQAGIGPVGPVPVRGQTPPAGAGGLFCTASDYGRFAQMLLNGGTREGHRYLSAAAFQALTTIGTGDLPTGYTKTRLNHDLGWGAGVAIVRASEGPVAAQLSPGSFGHPGAWGTGAWIDPVKGAAYVMMVQRPNMPDNFENPPALAFIRAAAAALPPGPR